MTLSTGTAVDINSVVIKPVSPHCEHGNHSEGFVDFPQIDVTG